MAANVSSSPCRRRKGRVHSGVLHDVDEDEVAGVYYALKAISDPSLAPYAASRAMDAAFARVPYADGASGFRPVAEDADSPEVRRELAWQQAALVLIEGPSSLEDLARRLRS